MRRFIQTLGALCALLLALALGLSSPAAPLVALLFLLPARPVLVAVVEPTDSALLAELLEVAL